MDDPPCTSKSLKDPTSSSSTSTAIPANLNIQHLGDFGDYLFQQYSLLKLVLSYLNYYDLNTLREVNSSLKIAADNLLKKRTWIQYATLNYMHGTVHRPEPIHCGRFVNLKIEPKALFTFECMTGGPSSRARPKICMRLRDGNDYRFFPRSDIVPKSVKTFVPMGGRSVIYPEKNEKNEMIIVHTVLRKKLALLYLPASDSYDVSVYTTAISSDTFSQREVTSFFFEDRRCVRGVILIKSGAPSIDNLNLFIFKLVNNSQRESFAFSGGHVSSLDCYNPSKKSIPGIVKIIVFRGDGIRCFSDFIGAATEDGVIEALEYSAECAYEHFGKLDPHKSFIMMFPSDERLEVHDHTHIKNAFPNIPIFGVQSFAGIGSRTYREQMSGFNVERRMLDDLNAEKTTYMVVSID